MQKQYSKTLSIILIVTLFGLLVFFFPKYLNPLRQPSSPSPSQPTSLPNKLNSWYASAYSFPSNYIHALPGMYQLTEKGIAFSQHMPLAHDLAVVTAIGDNCTMQFGDSILSTSVPSYSDWSVQIDFYGSNLEGSLHLVQGMPVAYINTNSQEIALSCPDANYSTSDSDIIISHHNKHYLLEGEGATTSQLGQGVVTLKSESGNYRLSILPSLDKLQLFQHNPWQITNHTTAAWEHVDGQYLTNYSFGTTNQPALFTLWPHHTPYTQGVKVLGTYDTALGQLQLVQEQGFQTQISSPDLLDSFVAVSHPQHKLEIIQAIQADLEHYLAAGITGGVYFRGTQLGALSTLLNLAQIYDLEEEGLSIANLLTRELTSSLGKISYDPQQLSMISSEPEFGHEFGNDHHFHYGYYIRAAATLAQYNSELAPIMQSKIDDLVLDIANTDYSETRFPALRHYSTYEGHSWADGRADFADGNNQESTSEALNAWYSIYLWGKVTNRIELQEKGSWLFSQELAGTRAYWFAHNNPFPDSYAHSFASIVWSSKRDFATWFSADPMHIFGIQLLPITPASTYLSQLDFTTINQDIYSTTTNPSSHEWGDLYTIFTSYHNPDKAISLLDMVSSSNGTKLNSLPLQMVYSQLE